MSEFDSIELSRMEKSAFRRQRCTEHLPKILFGVYVATAVTVTFLCLTVFRSSIVSSASLSASSSPASTADAFTSLAKSNSDIDSADSDSFEALYYCSNSNDHLCSNSQGSWCCPSSESCGSAYFSCNANVGLIVGIIVAVWLGPLALYLIIIAIVRCSQIGRFQALANSGRYQSWVIVSGCFQMSVDSSSGDAEFNQAAFSLINVYGGCGDECVMHCIGIWCFSFCYPCCMCCVSAGRNQTKVGTLQSALVTRGYNTNVQFLSSVIPACCNSIFIGLVNRQQPNVMVVTTGVGGQQVYAQQVIYAQPSPAGYAQPLQYVQPQYGQPVQYVQPGYAPQPMYAPYAAGASAAPAYTAAPTNDVISSAPAAAAVSAQPPEVVKPLA